MNLEIRLTFDSIEDAIAYLRGREGTAAPEPSEQGPAPSPQNEPAPSAKPRAAKADTDLPPPTRAVKNLIDYFELTAEDVAAMPRSGKGNRITQTDVRNYIHGMREAAPPAPEAPAPAPEPDPFAEDEAPTVVDYEAAKLALKAFNEHRGLQACVEILSRYGVTRLRDLEEKRFGELVAEMDKILKEGKA